MVKIKTSLDKIWCKKDRVLIAYNNICPTGYLRVNSRRLILKWRPKNKWSTCIV